MKAFKVDFITKYKVVESRIIVAEGFLKAFTLIATLEDRAPDPLARILTITLLDEDVIIQGAS